MENLSGVSSKMKKIPLGHLCRFVSCFDVVSDPETLELVLTYRWIRLRMDRLDSSAMHFAQLNPLLRSEG